jgi:NAD+ kinase
MMNIAIYAGREDFVSQDRIVRMLEELSAAGCAIRNIVSGADIKPDIDMLMSIGGDGTFLSASAMVSNRGIPVVGVNLGRLGFLSENRPEDVAQAVLSKDYTVENRTLLQLAGSDSFNLPEEYYNALNEMTVHRSGPSMLEVEVSVDGIRLPTYWADGLVISTSSGSTAYSLSVGGPIVLPESRVLIISPISPHNLNVRPLVVPDSSEIKLKMDSRDGEFVFSSDNRSVNMPAGTEMSVSVAQFSLRRVRLNRSNFINALTQKLFWGEDVRNIK